MGNDVTTADESPEVEGQESQATTGDEGQQFDEPIVETDPDQRAVMEELLEGSGDDGIEIPVAKTEEEVAAEREKAAAEAKDEGPTSDQQKVAGDAGKESPADGGASPASDPLFVTVTHKGKDYTIPVQSEEEAEVLRAKLTSAEQLPHLQGKYTEALERLANYDETGTSGDPGQGAQSGGDGQLTINDISQMNPDQFKEFTAPLVDTYKNAGVFGEDGEFAEAFPQMASSMALMFSVGLPALQVLSDLRQGFSQFAMEQNARAFFTSVDTTFEQLAEKGPGFEPLKEQENRRDFYKHLHGLGIADDRILDPDFLASQWRAFNHKAFDHIEADVAAQAERKRAAELARASQGNRGGVSPRPAPSSTGNEQVDLMRSLITG
jgi:hypothetical protein